MSSVLLFSSCILSVSLSVTVYDIPFSWDNIPVWAFPGFSNHFLTDYEVYQESNSLNNFSFLLLAEYNASCLLPNGTYYPATTTNWWYECSSTPGDISNITVDLMMYPNAESSIAYQSMQLKTKYLNNKGNSIILAYIETINAQLSYVASSNFNKQNYSSYWLYIQNKGYINCLEKNEGMDCDYQGPSEHQFDHRQQSVREYFTNNLLNGILFDYPPYSQYLDGVFLDTINAWIQPYALCYNWKCTDREFNELWNASLLITDDSLKYLTMKNKIGSVSIRGDIFDMRDYYLSFMDIVFKYKSNTVRYYEEMCNNGQVTVYNTMITIMNETKYNISIQVHALQHTYNPDYVELAGYLIVASENVWFSQSIQGWGVNDSWWIEEFNYKLGKPLNDATCNYTFFSYDVNKWIVLQNQSVFSSMNRVIPGDSDNTYGIMYIGTYNTFNECVDGVNNLVLGYHFTSLTYFNNEVIDNKGGNWTNMCYARIGVIIGDVEEDNNIGWFAKKFINATSANIFDYYCERDFEHLNVKINPISFQAWLTWK